MQKQQPFIECGCRVPTILNETTSGKVHSVFKNGVNIKFGDYLLFIGNFKNGSVPFGIHYNPVPFDCTQFQVNDIVSWNKQSGQLITKKYVLQLKNISSTRNVINKIENIQRAYINLLKQIEKLPLNVGLSVHLQNLLMDTPQTPDEIQLLQLTKLVKSTDREKLLTHLKYFIGRGSGLTPSGDDFLVGLLACHSLYPTVSNEFLEELANLVNEKKYTTDISNEFLSYALKQEFSSVIVHLMNGLLKEDSIIKENVERLLQVGHSSGADTLLGIIVGLRTHRQLVT